MIIKMILIMIKMIWHDLHLLKEPSPKRFMKPLSAEWHLISEMDQEKSNYDTIAIRANTPPPRPLQEISRSNINIYQHISTVWSLLLRTSYSLTTCTNISAEFYWNPCSFDFRIPRSSDFDILTSASETSKSLPSSSWAGLIRVETSAKPAEAWHGLTEIQHCIAWGVLFVMLYEAIICHNIVYMGIYWELQRQEF